MSRLVSRGNISVKDVRRLRWLVLIGALAALLGCTEAMLDPISRNQANAASADSTPPRNMNRSSGASGQDTVRSTTTASSTNAAPMLNHSGDGSSALHLTPSRPLPLPWAEFAEMYEPILDANMSPLGWAESGFLEMDGDCVYLELVDLEEPFPSEHRRIALSLPHGWTQYDPLSTKIYVHQQSGFVYGPFTSGDFVSDSGFMSLAKSDVCGDRLIKRAWDLTPCSGNYTRHRIRCPVQQYSIRYGVFPAEAQRQLERLPELEAVLVSLRDLEQQRFAGWGIDRDRDEGIYRAWLWLTGSSSPSDAAQRLADRHDDVVLRVGAVFSHDELERALVRFDGGRDLYLPLSDSSYLRYPPLELKDAVTRSYVDHRANGLAVALDPERFSRPVVSAVLTGDARVIENRYEISRDELRVVIGSLLEDRLGVPVSAMDLWP